MMALARKIVSGDEEEDENETMEEVFAQARNAESEAEELLVDDGWKAIEVEPETVEVNGNGHHADGIGPTVELVLDTGHHANGNGHAAVEVNGNGNGHHGYTGARGYHPLLAIAAGTGEVLMSRLREGRANTARGAAHFLRETVGRVRYGGARGQLTVRADSGFYAHTVVAACREMDVRLT